MNRLNCISEPSHQQTVMFRQYQVDFCQDMGKKMAVVGAALISYFKYWHEYKLDKIKDNTYRNKIREMHGDEGLEDVSLYQWHTLDEMQDALMGLASKNTISKAKDFLIERGLISQHKNPNPKYAFDKTGYYVFHPEVIQSYIDREYKAEASNPKTESPSPKTTSRSRKNGIYNKTTYETTSELNNNPLPPTGDGDGLSEESVSIEGNKQVGQESVSIENKKTWRESLEQFFDTRPGVKLEDPARAREIYISKYEQELEGLIGRKQLGALVKSKSDLFDPRFILLLEWLEYKKQIKSPYKSSRGLTTIMNQFGKRSKQVLEKLLEYSYSNEYQGIIWEKEKSFTQPQYEKWSPPPGYQRHQEVKHKGLNHQGLNSLAQKFSASA